MKKDHIWNHVIWSCKNGKYLASIIDNLLVTCDEIIGVDVDAEAKSKDEAKLFEEIKKNFSKKIFIETICETKSFYILLAFL